MKIAWYTPFSDSSAIGRFSRIVADALRAAEVEVQIVRSESKTTAIRGGRAASDHEEYCWAADHHRNPKAKLDDFDLVVYNVGDHFENHAYCFDHQAAVPGLTILHDYCLHHALNGHCSVNMMQGGHYGEQVASECGRDAAETYNQLVASDKIHLWWHQEIARYPIYRWAIQNTLGVITHAEFYRDTVASRIGCPVTTIPLAYDTPAVSPGEDAPPSSPRIMLTVGAVNANKRYESIIGALAESTPLRHQLHYRIVGPANPPQQKMIDLAVQSHAEPPNVTVTGQVSREVLQQEINAADVIACLRYPVLEGASASAVEGLLSGKPMLVCDTGCYSEIPDELVYKISPDNLRTDITKALTSILDDYPSAMRRAQAAKAWARRRHSPDAYADGLIDFAERVLFDRPILNVVDRVADCIRGWNGHADPCFLRRLDGAMSDLFRPMKKKRLAA